MNRIPSIDSLRVFAILAVLTLHSRLFRSGELQEDWAKIAEVVLDHVSRFAVPFFFFVTGFLMERGRGEQSPLDRVFPQIKRLLTIYIGWSILLLVIEQVERSLRGGSLIDASTIPNRLIYGVRMHLWFLPALMLSSLVYASLAQMRICGLVCVLLYGIGLAGGTYTPITGIDFGVWSRNGFFFGTLFIWAGAKQARSQTPPRLGIAVLMFLFGLALHGCELAWMHQQYEIAWLHERMNYFIGTAFMGIGCGCLALSRPHWGEHSILPRLGIYTLGIYILHLDIMQWQTEIVECKGIPGQVLLVWTTYAITLGVVWIIAKWKPARKWVT